MSLATLKRIQEDKEAIISDREQMFPEAAVDGDYFRQGDLYIWKRDKMPKDLSESKERQLAPGSTKGARHIAEGDVAIFTTKGGDALQGPWLKVESKCTVTHPEHGNVVLPNGNYEITYQRAFAEELKRVLD